MHVCVYGGVSGVVIHQTVTILRSYLNKLLVLTVSSLKNKDDSLS